MSSKYWDISMNYQGGCSPCNTGCAHCWAADCASKRLANHPLYKGLTKNGKWTGEIRVMPELIKVIRGKPKTIFWCNMSDMFHPAVPFRAIYAAFCAMLAMPQHTHLVLTKRIKLAVEFCQWWFGIESRTDLPDNIHLGVTICTQQEADEKIPILLQIPAAYKWISFEPLLESINQIPFDNRNCDTLGHIEFIDGVVVGCESGPRRRECKLEWIRSIVEQCKAAGVGCYVKQIPIVTGGGVSTGSRLGQLGHKGKVWTNYKVSHEPNEWPEWARVREAM